MNRSRGKRIISKRKVAIFVDGECEFWYFQMMKRNEPELKIDLLPTLPRKKKLSEQYNEIKKSANDYDLVVWIVDLDKINEEEKQKPKGGNSPKELFRTYYEDLNKIDNVEILISNPCLEFWLLLHFEDTSRFFDECEKAGQQLKKHLKDYQKTEKYYVKNDLYKKLKQNQETAIKNSKRLGNFNLEDFQTAVCEMFMLFDNDMDEKKNQNILKSLK